MVAENSAKEIMEMSGFVEQQRNEVDEVNQITEHMNRSTQVVARNEVSNYGSSLNTPATSS